MFWTLSADPGGVLGRVKFSWRNQVQLRTSGECMGASYFMQPVAQTFFQKKNATEKATQKNANQILQKNVDFKLVEKL